MFEFMGLLRNHMGQEAYSALTILDGLNFPFKRLKLIHTDGHKLSDNRNETTATILRSIPSPERDTNTLAQLILTVVPIMEGSDVGSTQVVTTNDGKGTLNRGHKRAEDGKRSALMKSVRQNPGLWFWSYICASLNLNPESVRRCMRC